MSFGTSKKDIINIAMLLTRLVVHHKTEAFLFSYSIFFSRNDLQLLPIFIIELFVIHWHAQISEREEANSTSKDL